MGGSCAILFACRLTPTSSCSGGSNLVRFCADVRCNMRSTKQHEKHQRDHLFVSQVRPRGSRQAPTARRFFRYFPFRAWQKHGWRGLTDHTHHQSGYTVDVSKRRDGRDRGDCKKNATRALSRALRVHSARAGRGRRAWRAANCGGARVRRRRYVPSPCLPILRRSLPTPAFAE